MLRKDELKTKIKNFLVEALGWASTTILVLAYTIFGLFPHHELLFILVNLLASIGLTIYSILKKTYPLAVVNGYIVLMLLWRLFRYLTL